MLYKNVSNTTKTFHGVTIKPGEIKDVPGYINNRGFIQVNEMPKEPPKSVEPKKSAAPKAEPAKTDKAEDKAVDSKQEKPESSKQESKNEKKEEQ